ncbi:FG-GAP-like repeat-containing protein [Fulvivirga lutimaris]|uniref:FG-GAP-like repeat-containing protein n=1 Tax=Fulvivirga lutimaris TaxID=1819566 RepID=UPI0016256BFB|nr:FG-GAP-like repeat-containing protein [Fulvivirga lutimaris]
MTLNKSLIIALLLVAVNAVKAQPRITNIDPENTFAGGEVVISGTGFGTNVSDIIVWFGSVRAASIEVVSDNSITTTVPAGAVNGPIIVEKISTGQQVRSKEYFFLSHHGSPFDIAQLQSPEKYRNGTVELFDICGCDFDNDGLTDLASTETTGTEITLLTNTSTIGDINFNVSSIDANTPTTGMGCGDLDGDGKQDLFMTRAGSNRNQLYIYKNTTSTPGTITFGSQQLVSLVTNNSTSNPYQAVRVVAGDLNNDGKPDLVISNANGSEKLLNIIPNTSSVGTISFGTPTIVPLPDMSANSGLSLNDMDNDGNLDLVLTRTLAANVFVYRNSGGFSFEAPLIVSTGSQAITNVSAIDLDADGLKEIVTTEVFNDQVLIYKNNSTSGSLSFGTAVNFVAGKEPWTVKGADLNGDGLLDLAVSTRDETKYAVLINEGGLNFTPSQQSLEQATRNIFAGDLDGDGKPDLAFTSLAIPDGDFSIQVVRNTNCYEPEILNDQPLAICPTQTITLEAPSNPGVTFSWKKDGGDLALATSSIDVTAAGSYEVTAISEGGNCTSTATIVVNDGTGTIPSDPVASNDGPGCVGQSVTLAVDAQSGATYSWTGPNGFTSSDQNPVISNLTSAFAGKYKVLVKIGDCLSSEAETDLVISDVSSFSISAGGPTTLCSGGSVTLSTGNTAGYTYKWMKDGAEAGGATNTFVASANGVYSLEVTDDASGCAVATNEITVNVLTAPVSSFTLTNPICVGIDAAFTNTSTVDNSATVTYNWNFGDGTSIVSQDATHTYTSGGTFDVTLTVSYDGVAGCSTFSTQQATVVEAVPVSITASKNSICDDETIDLTANGTFVSSTWNTGASTDVITVDAPGAYSVTSTDNNGCISDDTFDLVQGTVPTISITADGNPGPIVVPAGNEVQLEATGADSYLWSPSDFLSATDIANPISTPTADILYTVIGALIDGCTGSGQIQITLQSAGNEILITPAKAFAPDNLEDAYWRIESLENYPDCTLSIYDERGTLILREQNYNNTWDGTYEGTPLPEGVYYFVFACPELNPKTGSILLVR